MALIVLDYVYLRLLARTRQVRRHFTFKLAADVILDVFVVALVQQLLKIALSILIILYSLEKVIVFKRYLASDFFGYHLLDDVHYWVVELVR